TERGNFILTLYEKRVAPEDLPFFIALMDHLAHQGVPCPRRCEPATARRCGSYAADRRRSSPFLPACGRAASSRSIAPGSAAPSPRCIAPAAPSPVGGQTAWV